jgi:hypothetical protein
MAFGGTIIGRGVIPVTVDKSAVDRDLDTLEKDSKSRFGRIGTAAKAGMALATGGAVLGIGKFIGDSIGRASDLGEVLSKATQIFGREALPMLERFGNGAARSIGQSKTAALDAASTFGIFGKIAGKSGKDLAGFSIDMTKLASDMASFGNTTPEEAVEALGAALRGESEPIRRYGVMLDDATLKAEALALGILKPVKDEGKIKAYRLRMIEQQAAYNDAVAEFGPKSMEALKAQAAMEVTANALEKATTGTIPPLTAQQKVLASQSAIMRQTKDQQGDFERTSGGLANQQRILKAQFEDLSTSIGQKFLPMAVQVAQWANDSLIPGIIKAGEWLGIIGGKFAEVGGFISDNIVWFGALAGAIGLVALAMAAHSAVIAINSGALAIWFAQTTLIQTATRAWAAVQWVLNAALSANPIGLLVGGLILLGVALYTAYQKSETFRDIVNGAFGAVRDVVGGVVGWFQNTFVPFFTEKIPAAFDAVKDWVEQKWKAAWGKIQDWILEPIQSARDTVGNIFGEGGPVRGAFDRVRGWVEEKFKAAWGKVEDWVLNPIRTARDTVGTIFGAEGPVRGAFSAVAGWVETKFTEAWNKVEGWVLTPIRAARDTLGTIFGPEGGVRAAFSAVSGWVETQFKAAWDKIEGWILTPIRTARDVIQNIMGTGDDGEGPIRRAFKAAVSGIETIWNGIKKAAGVPVNFVIDAVWNNGLREVIGKIPGVDTPGKIDIVHWGDNADGGVLPGRTPGRDVHQFVSTTGIRLGLSGGEAVMRPEWTDAVGPSWVEYMNGLARRGGAKAVKAAMGFWNGGIIPLAAASVSEHTGYPNYAADLNYPGYDDYGKPVRAWRAGTMAQKNYIGDTSYGRWAVVNHDGGTSSLYAHLSGFSTIGVGKPVAAGQTIGYVGDIGNTGTPPTSHLHFEIKGAAPIGSDTNEQAGFFDAIGAIKDVFGKVKGWIEELDTMGGWGGLVKNTIPGIVGNLKDWIDDKIPGPSIFDRGGMLGRDGGRNLSGKPERVLSPRQTVAFERLVDHIVRGPGFPGGGGYGGGGAVRSDWADVQPSVTVHAPQNTDPYQVADIAAGNLAAILKGA